MILSTLKMNGDILIERVFIARTFWSRFLGLMLRSGIGENEAIFFPRCNSIHTFFMRFPIDVVFLSREGRIDSIEPSLKPWRLLWPRRSAHVLEMKATQASVLGLRPGVSLQGDGFFNAN